MKKYFMTGILFLGFLGLCFCPSFAEEDKKELQHWVPPGQDQKPYQGTQASRPILPPVVPSSLSAASPTPSPHIAAPPLTPDSIKIPFNATAASQVRIPSVPGVATQVTAPTIPVQVKLPEVPVVGNAMGEVLDIGRGKDSVPWIEVDDELFNQSVRIQVRNLRNTPIVKGESIMHFTDIRKGDVVNIIFMREKQENIANLIRIVTEEEMEMMQGMGSAQSEAPDGSDTVEKAVMSESGQGQDSE